MLKEQILVSQVPEGTRHKEANIARAFQHLKKYGQKIKPFSNNFSYIPMSKCNL